MDWNRDATYQRALQHRTAEFTLRLSGTDGKPLAGRPVAIRQVRHKFLFGCNMYMLFRCGDDGLERAYRQRFQELLNYATLPFYWGSYEPQEGSPAEGRLRQMGQWCAEHGLTTKGHPLCWHEVVPAWLNEKADDAVEPLQWGRIAREVGGFGGLIDLWDVINEVCVMPTFPRGPNAVTRLCGRLGQVELVRRVFQVARQANPRARLVLNDFDVTEKYETLIRRCLDAGVEFDVIGIQSHMHVGYWGPQKVQEVLERFARFGKPLHFTEATLLSGALKTDNDWSGHHPGWETSEEGEERQAREAEEFYRILFAHPAVEAITWWDFADLGAWQGAPAGLLRKDMSPKPVYDALKGLIRGEWWTRPLELVADARGQVRFRGFLGGYEVALAGRRQQVELNGPGQVEILSE